MKELKKRLLQEKEELLKRISDLRQGDPFLDPDHVNDNAAVDTDVREQIGHETVEAQILTLQKKVSEIENALVKIEKKKYGKCERCKKPILVVRLKLLPEARYCVECEKKLKI